MLVTGGTGLVGSWLTKRLLASGAEVVLLVKDVDPRSELVRSGDLARVALVYGSLEDFGVLQHAVNLHQTECVFHLGAQTLVEVAHRYPLATFEANVRGTYNLLEVCRVHGAIVRRVVVASSDKAYGEKAELPYTEEMSLDARHTYDVSKSCADLIAQGYAHTYRVPVAITRFGNVYGGGDLNASRIVPGTIKSLLRRERPIVRSDGSFTRDYLYVEDVVAGYLLLAQALDAQELHGQAFNFSTETRVSVLDLVARLQRLMGATDLAPDVRNTASAEIRHQHLSARKARERLGWEPRFDLDAGLTRTIAWYRELTRK
ncbi:MAG: NAD-dependent epimerase/dehydratase family protein [Planctomycetes bacterium]|nr:NAD-dependent epimerase/dehydratase family protein [Planctomycetota bacterium]